MPENVVRLMNKAELTLLVPLRSRLMLQPPASEPPDSGSADEGQPRRPSRVGSGFAEGGPLDAAAPGTALAGLACRAFEDELGELSDDELVGLLGAARRLASWQAAIEFGVVGELDKRRTRGRSGRSRVSEQVSEELAAALTLTSKSADALLCVSRDLARLPMVFRALYTGTIDRARAEVFAQELAGLSEAAAAAIGAAFWRLAGTMTTGQLRAALRAMVLRMDPAAARRRAAKGRRETRVELWPEHSGNTALAGRQLPPAEAIAADQRITAIAQELKSAGATGTLDQLRAAVFTALLTGRALESLRPAQTRAASPAGFPAGQGLAGLTGSVHLTMPLATWLGRSDGPGEAAGYGPLDADACRALARQLGASSGTRWTVTLTYPDGRPAAHAAAATGPGPPGMRGSPGPQVAAWLKSLRFDWLERGICSHSRQTTAYQPGVRLRRLIQVRHRTCTFPGCRWPARRCDIDHTIAFEQGGVTCECNLEALCRRHHQTKQAPGWQLTQPRPGILVWTAPHGRTYSAGQGSYPT